MHYVKLHNAKLHNAFVHCNFQSLNWLIFMFFPSRISEFMNFRPMWMDYVQRRSARPTRYQPRATPWVNNGVVDCALTGQKHYERSDKIPQALQAVLKFRLVGAFHQENVVLRLDDEGAQDGVEVEKVDELLVVGRQRVVVIITGNQ